MFPGTEGERGSERVQEFVEVGRLHPWLCLPRWGPRVRAMQMSQADRQMPGGPEKEAWDHPHHFAHTGEGQPQVSGNMELSLQPF